MKRIIALILFLLFLIGFANAESPATPTDLVEIPSENIIEEGEELYTFEDDDYGEISEEILKRQVLLDFLKQPDVIGDEVTLIAILINFKETDEYRFEWEESEDGNTWNTIPNETDQTYTFILDRVNVTHSWRVKVIV